MTEAKKPAPAAEEAKEPEKPAAPPSLADDLAAVLAGLPPVEASAPEILALKPNTVEDATSGPHPQEERKGE